MTLRAFVALLPVLLLGACDRGAEPQLAGDPAGEPPAAEQAAPSEQAPAADEENAQTQVLEESAGLSEEMQPDDEPIKLARADGGEPNRDWKFREGKDFDRLVPTQPTVGGPDKIEVAEVFWYGCPHCLHLEPYMKRWAANLPADVRFVRIPATWNPLVKLHAQLYYTEQALVQNGAIRNPEEFRAAWPDRQSTRQRPPASTRSRKPAGNDRHRAGKPPSIGHAGRAARFHCGPGGNHWPND